MQSNGRPKLAALMMNGRQECQCCFITALDGQRCTSFRFGLIRQTGFEAKARNDHMSSRPPRDVAVCPDTQLPALGIDFEESRELTDEIIVEPFGRQTF